MSHEGFILSQGRAFINNAQQAVFQGRLRDGGKFHWTVTRPRIVFFIKRSEARKFPEASRRQVALRNFRGEELDAIYFSSQADLNRAREACLQEGVLTYEADVDALSRHLMEHGIRGCVRFETGPERKENGILYFRDPVVSPADFSPEIRLLSLDIECNENGELYSVSLYGEDLSRVFMIDPETPGGKDRGDYISCRDERELLRLFFEAVQNYDPDALIGWNVVGFDLRVLQERCRASGVEFSPGWGAPSEIIAPSRTSNQWLARISGRAVLDGISMLRTAFVTLEDYSLATAAHELLGKQKLIEKTGREKLDEIHRLFREDKPALARYNLEDSRLVHEIFLKLNLHHLAERRARLTGLALDRVGGSVAAFDFLYLPRLHRRGFVAEDQGRRPGEGHAPGGLVLDSVPGFHAQVVTLDFKSLYPSIIRGFRVDPLAGALARSQGREGFPEQFASPLTRGPAGLSFATEYAILPDIIEELWAERDRAKQTGDATLSYAVKIIMNSFYGVLGSPGCRFYDPELAGTITRIGHWVLTTSREFIEEKGYRVIYGDTDSLFIVTEAEDAKNARDRGRRLTEELNDFLRDTIREKFSLESALCVEFEKLFSIFFLPMIRGRETGSKKRYAGLIENESGETELYFAGLESSRRDWTALARDFQRDLYRLVFENFGSSDLEEKFTKLIRERRAALFNGDLDDKLEYRKGLSKRPDEYVKNTPPHVRAAQKLGGNYSRVVRYRMTQEGPEPVQLKSEAPLDYEHYSEKQLAPIADALLRFFNASYGEITGDGKQLSLF